MPANVPGSSASFPANVVVPVDGDAPNASSVVTGLTNLADRTAYLNSKTAKLAGGNTFTGAQDFGDFVNFDDDIRVQGAAEFVGNVTIDTGIIDDTNSAVALFQLLAIPGTDTRKLIGEFNSSNSLGASHRRGRIYQAKDGLGLELTFNAKWDEGTLTWGYDLHTSSEGAVILRLGALTTGTVRPRIIVGFYNGATGWTDANFFTTKVDILDTQILKGYVLGCNSAGVGAFINLVREDVQTIGVGGAPAFQNLWANAAGGQPGANFWKGIDGVVHLGGAINTGAAGTTAFTLPAGYFDSSKVVVLPAGRVTGGTYSMDFVVVDTSGNVKPNSAGGTYTIYLDGCSFPV